MTDTELNAALARLRGWDVIDERHGSPPDVDQIWDLPDMLEEFRVEAVYPADWDYRRAAIWYLGYCGVEVGE